MGAIIRRPRGLVVGWLVGRGAFLGTQAQEGLAAFDRDAHAKAVRSICGANWGSAMRFLADRGGRICAPGVTAAALRSWKGGKGVAHQYHLTHA